MGPAGLYKEFKMKAVVMKTWIILGALFSITTASAAPFPDLAQKTIDIQGRGSVHAGKLTIRFDEVFGNPVHRPDEVEPVVQTGVEIKRKMGSDLEFHDYPIYHLGSTNYKLDLTFLKQDPDLIGQPVNDNQLWYVLTDKRTGQEESGYAYLSP